MITVIGLGYVGLPIAISAVEAGYIVNGFDTDSKKITSLKSGISNSPEVDSKKLLDYQSEGKIKFSSIIDDFTNSSIFIIAVPTPLDLNHNPELKYLKEACESIATVVKSRSLIINESTSYIGTLRNFILPLIKSISKVDDLDFVVAPERIDPGNTLWNVRNTPRIIGGINQSSVDRAKNFYKSICNNVFTVSSPEVAEAAKLFENTFRQVNIALVNEFSEIAAKFGFSSYEAISSAATKPFGFMPFYPSIGTGGHCIPIDPSYLVFSGESVGARTDITSAANLINLNMPKNTVNRIKDFLGGSLENKFIQIAGITYKPNIPDIRESPAVKLMELLQKEGSRVIWSDPFVTYFNGSESSSLDPSVDLGLIVSPHSNFDFTIWRNSMTTVLDLSPNTNNYGWPKFF